MQLSWRCAEAALFPLSTEHSHTIKGEHIMQQPDPRERPLNPALSSTYSKFGNQPPQYTPPVQPPSKKKMSFGKFLAIGCGGLAVLVVLIIVIVAVAANAGNNSTSTGNTAASATQPAQPTQVAQPTQPPATTTSNSGNVQPTHGTPRIGGPMSDFYGKYGTPHNQGSVAGSETWFLNDQNQTIIGAAPDTNGMVNWLDITNSTSWSNQQMQTYCEQFMPSDASQFNQAGSFIDYHSSIGEIVLLLGPQSCVLTIGQS